jgi:hypothetical protein
MNLEKTSRGGVGELLRYAPFQNVLILYGCTSPAAHILIRLSTI